jgi:hypothetical protein
LACQPDSEFHWKDAASEIDGYVSCGAINGRNQLNPKKPGAGRIANGLLASSLQNIPGWTVCSMQQHTCRPGQNAMRLSINGRYNMCGSSQSTCGKRIVSQLHSRLPRLASKAQNPKRRSSAVFRTRFGFLA